MSIDPLPVTWTALAALAFVLGLRHGLDADHLATIDGLARCNAATRPRLARRAGLLFSLGHGAVVMAVALAAGTLADRWHTPAWLTTSGVLVSVAFLFALAFLNLRAVWRAAPGSVVMPTGLRGRWITGHMRRAGAGTIAAIGALFALSFDTVSQAAMFALAAGRFGGVGPAVALAALFVAGMVCVDGLNGWWISRLLRRADRRAARASRIMALAIAAIGFCVGGLALARWTLPVVDAWAEPHEWAFGGGVIVAVALAFAVALARGRRAAPAATAGGD